MVKDKLIQVRVDKEQYKKVLKLAGDKGNIGKWIRERIKKARAK